MRSLPTIIFNLIALLCIILLTVLVIENLSIQSRLILPNGTHFSVASGIILLIGSGLAIIPVFLKQWNLSQRLRSEVKQFELRREKAEVKAETNQDQIRVLESKIQTLEKALEQALSPSSQKER